MIKLLEDQQLSPNEHKLVAILMYAPIGIAEIDESGKITHLNLMGETLLQPLMTGYQLSNENIFPILEYMAPGLADKIKNFKEDAGTIIMNELYSFSLPGQDLEKYFNVFVNKIFPGCIFVNFADITESYLGEKAITQFEMERAIEQGKYEIASGVLHDIGNAVVGFGSYLTRIKRVFDQNNPGILQNLATFFSDQQKDFATVIGEAKAKAVVDMLNGIAQTQKSNREEISKSITEQLNIITHIQEILNIQRQYVSGEEAVELGSVNLRSIINDCMAMLFASFDKRGIAVSLNIPQDLPMLKGDRTKLMQVVLNLLKNSLEAIEVTAPEKRISIQVYSKAHLLVLQLQDSGSGFDQSVASQLFKRGFTTKNSGTGIGLYNCKAIIESHGGTIEITSEGPGKGAFTVISLPA
jgi:signal transduction histidine kinase